MSQIRSSLIFKRLRQQISQNFLNIGIFGLNSRFRLLLSLFLGLNIAILQPQQLLALNNFKQPIQVASVWRAASFPVENFQAYTSGFGYRTDPISGESRFHNGLDIAAPLGSYVRNWWTGRVVELSDNTSCGTMVKVRSGEWQHTYCHLNGQVESNSQGTYLLDSDGGIVLWQGQQVAAGERIGRIGMTGRTTGPHLHWVLIYNGEYIDPAEVLRAMY
jgi:murein DD-endopeptidase MepM/ murein hydrolase activator NlpD